MLINLSCSDAVCDVSVTAVSTTVVVFKFNLEFNLLKYNSEVLLL